MPHDNRGGGVLVVGEEGFDGDDLGAGTVDQCAEIGVELDEAF